MIHPHTHNIETRIKKKKKKTKIKRKEKDFIFILNFGVVRRHGSIHQLHTTTTRAHQLYYIKVYRLFKEIEPMTKILKTKNKN